MRFSGFFRTMFISLSALALSVLPQEASAGEMQAGDSYLQPLSTDLQSKSVQIPDLSWLFAEALLYGRPGTGFGKGHVYSFASDCSPAFVLSPLPKRFSWADLGKKPAVRSQGALGTCWALTAAEAIESDLLPGTSIEFSADHISMQNGFDISQNEGGDYSMIMSYMADYKGPVLESEDPYGDGKSPEGLTPAAHVTEMRLLKGMSESRIRHMIYRFGAVQSSLSMDRGRTDSSRYPYYNEETYGYFDPMTEELNHDILVLGWDDSYSRDNFRMPPDRDGAWICQNSWGDDFGDGGIFYVSYEDANLFRKGGIVYTDVKPADPCDRVLETDLLGWQARQGYGQESAYFAGVFDSEKEQELSAVGFYATGPATAYKVFLVPEYSDVSDLSSAAADGNSGICSSDSGEEDADSVLLAAGWLENPGFYTIPVMQKQTLASGQKFAVIVWIDTQNAERPVAVETKKDKYTANVTLDGRESYISSDGESWDRTQTRYKTNVCLKVYTRTY